MLSVLLALLALMPITPAQAAQTPEPEQSDANPPRRLVPRIGVKDPVPPLNGSLGTSSPRAESARFSNPGPASATAEGWRTMAGEPPAGREGSVAVWTGTELLAFTQNPDRYSWPRPPGLGFRYNPVDNRWASLPNAGAPDNRVSPLAFWTGSEMLVWGGATATGAAKPVVCSIQSRTRGAR
jgi:hypothetical protein